MDTPKLVAGHFRAEESTTFNVLALYEDFEAGKLAKDVYNRIRAQLPAELATDLELFRFDTFRTPRIKRLLQAQLSLPDAIIVAAGGEEALPEEVKLWIRQWASEKREGAALILLLRLVPESKRENAPAHSWLQTIAESTQTQLFSHAFGTKTRIESGKKPAKSMLADREDYSHAGINE